MSSKGTDLDMRETAEPRSYEEQVNTFKSILNHVLREGELPPACLTYDLPLVEALGDVARAAQDGSATHELIGEAVREFAKYAAKHDPPQR